MQLIYPRLALGALLLASPLLGRAQTSTTDAAPTPRYYVGLGAYSGYYQPLGTENYGSNKLRIPVQLTAGYQLRPRLAVQVGVAYSGVSRDFSTAYYTYYSPTGGPTGYTTNQGTYTNRRTSISALARYTLTRNLAHRLQFDALGGLTLEKGNGSSKGIRSDSVQNSFVSEPFNYSYSVNNVLLSLGGSVRYRVAPRFELTFDLLFNRGIWTDQYYLYKDITGSSALGLRYRFGK